MTVRGRRGHRVLVVALGAVLAAVAFLVVQVHRVSHPRVDEPGTSDAVVVLGPSTPIRVALAERLMSQGRAKTLAVSAHPADTPDGIPEPCVRRLPYPVTCFDPSPSTTQGEARAIGRLARKHGWRSIQVVTFGPQVERARLIVGRCFSGDARYLDSREPYDPDHQLRYQTFAFVKAWATPWC